MAVRVIALAVIAAAFVASAVAQDDVKAQFYSWAAKFDKQYHNLSEREYRMSVFNASLARIAQRNANSKSAVFAPNKFSDLTTEEFKQMYLMNNYQPRSLPEVEVATPTVADPPATFDWRKQKAEAVTPVKNQAQCGSCWAFSATETLESVWVLAGHEQVILGPQQIVDCDTTDDGCNGGNPNTAYEYVMSAGGQEYEKDYPYQGVNGNCNFNKADVAATISNWKYGTSSGDEKTMQANLVGVTPLSICVDAQPWQDYSSGVLTADQCGNSVDHCVQLVGYDSTASPPYWIVRNSWDTTWGIDGYIWLQMWQDTCALTSEVTYPIAGGSTTSSGTGAPSEFDQFAADADPEAEEVSDSDWDKRAAKASPSFLAA